MKKLENFSQILESFSSHLAKNEICFRFYNFFAMVPVKFYFF